MLLFFSVRLSIDLLLVVVDITRKNKESTDLLAGKFIHLLEIDIRHQDWTARCPVFPDLLL